MGLWVGFCNSGGIKQKTLCTRYAVDSLLASFISFYVWHNSTHSNNHSNARTHTKKGDHYKSTRDLNACAQPELRSKGVDSAPTHQNKHFSNASLPTPERTRKARSSFDALTWWLMLLRMYESGDSPVRKSHRCTRPIFYAFVCLAVGGPTKCVAIYLN